MHGCLIQRNAMNMCDKVGIAASFLNFGTRYSCTSLTLYLRPPSERSLWEPWVSARNRTKFPCKWRECH